uniref:NcMIC10 n=1 Tax=Neospora caninum TaxID=29176 RepID=Q9GSV4_NEOCA|nr:NcMIC10 precursor [Neospora caninum]
MALSTMNKPGPFRRLLGYGLLLGAVVLEAAFDLSAPAEAVALRRLDQKETVQALVEQHRFSNDYDQEAEYRRRRQELGSQTPEEIEEAKRKYRKQVLKEQQEDEELKKKTDAVIEELKKTAEERGLRRYPERDEDRTDDQQMDFETRQRELRNMDSATKAQLLKQRRKENEERNRVKRNSDDVMAELKQKLAARKKAM